MLKKILDWLKKKPKNTLDKAPIIPEKTPRHKGETNPVQPPNPKK